MVLASGSTVVLASRPRGSGVVVDGDLVAERHGLAGQDVAGGGLALFEGVVAAHGRLAGDDLRPAGAADAALAGERQVRADPLRAVEYRGAGRQGERRAAPV